jgi:hypothetical protein
MQEVFLPPIGFLPPLPGVAQRFSSLHQSLQDFHQPLHGHIQRLKEFLQPPTLPESKQFNAKTQRSRDAGSAMIWSAATCRRIPGATYRVVSKRGHVRAVQIQALPVCGAGYFFAPSCLCAFALEN